MDSEPEITLEQALSTWVEYRRNYVQFRWLIENLPLHIEWLMNHSSPHDSFFPALCKVYSAYENRLRRISKLPSRKKINSLRREIDAEKKKI